MLSGHDYSEGDYRRTDAYVEDVETEDEDRGNYRPSPCSTGAGLWLIRVSVDAQLAIKGCCSKRGARESWEAVDVKTALKVGVDKKGGHK